MIDGDRIVDLKKETDFIEQYVNLRNGYCDVLLTSPINVADTRVWLQRDDIEIRGIVRGRVLAGVVILFLNRKGEIAFFTKYKGAGLGSRLLKIIEAAARERGLDGVWAWVLADNGDAQKAFAKNGYRKTGESTKIYLDMEKKGVLFNKQLYKDDHP